MKIIFTFIFCLLSFSIFSQVDTIIKNPILESHFSYKYHNPLYVKYKLYQGGGNCNRSQFRFVTDNVKYSATSKDYVASGYDQGHLVNAEDFANDCAKEKYTFKFYNCVPQTPNLNRGIWKSYESKIRILSQKDSLLIICGSIFSTNKIPNTQVAIPDYCWKIVKSLSTGKVIYCLLFTNLMENNSVKSIPLTDLTKKLGYNPL